MRIRKENTVACIVDLQERLVPAMAGAEELMKQTDMLLKGLKLLGIPMVITQQYTKGLGMSLPSVFDVVGTQDYVEKLSFSASEQIQDFIQGKKFVILCGVEAHCCVLQTLIDLAEQGMIPILVTDCISSRKESDRKIAIERAKQEGAIITTSEAILFELLREAGTPLAKEVISLIK